MMREILVTICFVFFGFAAAFSAEEPLVYNDHGLRDPFWPLVSQGGALINYDSNLSVTEMVLEGVVGDSGEAIAIINGTIVKEGQKIGFYTVQKISSSGVTLLRDGKISVLHLKREE